MRSFMLEAAGNVLVIDVSTPGGVIKVRIPDYHAPFPMELIDANVRFRGVCGTAFNRQHQLVSVHLFVPSIRNLVVVDPALADPFSMPTSPIGSLATFAAKGVNVHRVKLEGIVTAQLPGRGLFVKDATGGLYIQSQDGRGFNRPGQTFSPELRCGSLVFAPSEQMRMAMRRSSGSFFAAPRTLRCSPGRRG